MLGCKCATYDEDTGRYNCYISGSSCMFMLPNPKLCAEFYGEGPEANNYFEEGE